MSINLNLQIQKKDLWLLAAIVVFLVGVGYVIAYGGNQPRVMGHTANEIEGGSQMKIGTYTGNRVQPHQITGVGFQPSYIHIIPNRGQVNDDMFIKTADMPAGYSRRFSTAAGSWMTDAIISFDADGFTVGNGGIYGINENAVIYTYVAMKE